MIVATAMVPKQVVCNRHPIHIATPTIASASRRSHCRQRLPAVPMKTKEFDDEYVADGDAGLERGAPVIAVWGPPSAHRIARNGDCLASQADRRPPSPMRA